ncbi:Holliday junction resolvase RecU [Saccharibacillus brassicae]|uniref:Holliday junction resolvase RecU n=2 Tax=Saccharibacillus brassicae TaxID=2583377 RepID=A0A4Y6V1H2_SACBS|nr:Holliday junction resolvase RecU [Saccharibacillus brassicae]
MNDGMIFETMLNVTNQMYNNRGEAVVNKRPTPIKILQTRGNLILKAAFDGRSTVDYDGVVQGRMITFEAKSTIEETRFDLNMIARHQYDYLSRCDAQDAICFVLVFFIKRQSIYLIPYELLKEYWDAADAGGRKSIPLVDLERRAHKFGTAGRAPVDYLPHVKKIWFEG